MLKSKTTIDLKKRNAFNNRFMYIKDVFNKCAAALWNIFSSFPYLFRLINKTVSKRNSFKNKTFTLCFFSTNVKRVRKILMYFFLGALYGYFMFSLMHYQNGFCQKCFSKWQIGFKIFCERMVFAFDIILLLNIYHSIKWIINSGQKWLLRISILMVIWRYLFFH